MGDKFAETYRNHYLTELTTLRYQTLNRAADLALGGGARDWLRSLGSGVLDDEYARALGSDAAMLKQLRALEAMYRPKDTSPGDDAA